MKYRALFGAFLPLCVLSMGLLAACGGSNAAAGSQQVDVTLSEFKVASSLTTFTTGTPYHFVVKNEGKTAHEFMVLAPTAGMGSMPMDDMHSMSLAMIDTIAPGETKTVDVTFPSSDAGKNFELSCHFPGHYEAGMKLPITLHT